jgi:hypothetical protein
MDKAPALKILTNVAYDLLVAENQSEAFSGESKFGTWHGWNFKVPMQPNAIQGTDGTSFPPGSELVYFAAEGVHEKMRRGGAVQGSMVRLYKVQDGDKTPIRVWVNQQEITGFAPAQAPTQPSTDPIGEPPPYAPPAGTSPEPPDTASQPTVGVDDSFNALQTPSQAHDPYLGLARIAAAWSIALRIGETLFGKDVRGENVTSIKMDVMNQGGALPNDCLLEGFDLLHDAGVIKDSEPLDDPDPDDLPL